MRKKQYLEADVKPRHASEGVVIVTTFPTHRQKMYIDQKTWHPFKVYNVSYCKNVHGQKCNAFGNVEHANP